MNSSPRMTADGQQKSGSPNLSEHDAKADSPELPDHSIFTQMSDAALRYWLTPRPYPLLTTWKIG